MLERVAAKQMDELTRLAVETRKRTIDLDPPVRENESDENLEINGCVISSFELFSDLRKDREQVMLISATSVVLNR
jgi:hypothetical protein